MASVKAIIKCSQSRTFTPEQAAKIRAFCSIRDAAKNIKYKNMDGLAFAEQLHTEGYQVKKYANKKYYAENKEGYTVPLKSGIANYLNFLTVGDNELELKFHRNEF